MHRIAKKHGINNLYAVRSKGAGQPFAAEFLCETQDIAIWQSLQRVDATELDAINLANKLDSDSGASQPHSVCAVSSLAHPIDDIDVLSLALVALSK